MQTVYAGISFTRFCKDPDKERKSTFNPAADTDRLFGRFLFIKHMLPQQPNQSIIDGIRCLQAVASWGQPAGISEIAVELGLETTRVHRLLRTLTHVGMLTRTQSRKYAPGPALPVLAAQALGALHFSGDSMTALEELMGTTGLITALGARWERLVCYLFHGKPGVESSRWLTAFAPMLVENSGLGMALLAQVDNQTVRKLFDGHPLARFRSVDLLLGELEQIRKQGYSFTLTTETHHTIGVVLTSNPNMAVGVSGVIKKKDVPNYLPPLQECARKLDHSFQSVSGSAQPISFL